MEFIAGFFKFVFLFLFIMIIIGYMALRKLRKRVEEQMRQQQDPKKYQEEHMGEIGVENNVHTANDDDNYDDYEEIK